MTRRERVRAALARKSTDKIPYQLEFAPSGIARMGEYLHDAEFMQKWDSKHIFNCMYEGDAQPVPNRPGFFQDDYGVVWDRTGEDKELGIMERLLIPDIQNSTYHFAEIDKAAFSARYHSYFETLGDHYPIAGLGLAVYERAWTLAGVSPLCKAMNDSPKETEALFEGICENALSIIDFALGFDFDGFFVGDDWTCATGLEMGADNWRRFIKPVLKRLYGRIHEKGKVVIQHSCGDISEIMPDLIEIGLDCYQTFQPECYDVKKIKREYGKDLAFWGGISTKKYLPLSSPEEARRQTIEALQVIGEGGGYVAAPSHAIPGNIHPETVLAILDVFEHQEKYL